MLEEYHAKYQAKPDEEIARRAKEKLNELARVFSAAPLTTESDPVLVAVLGCGDKRYVALHREIFSKVLAQPVDITTFDIDIQHLQGESQVVQHDCSTPLPGGPYDITFGHVVLPFLDPEKQLGMIKAGYDSLKPGGIQVQVLDPMNYEEGEETLEGLYKVDLDRLKATAKELGANVIEVALEIGIALVIVRS